MAIDYTTGKDPGKGYRWLLEDEVVNPADEMCSFGSVNNGHTVDTLCPEIIGQQWSSSTWWPIRRKTFGILDGF